MAYDPYAYNPHDYDYQDQWNNAAADQNAALRQQFLDTHPTPDSRTLATQQLVQRYGVKPPSFSNVRGQYSVNDQPINVTPDNPLMPASMTGEAGAQLQFAMAKRKAAQDFVDRASGNVPAGTAGRQLFQDPNFLHMTDADKAATYGQVYQHPLLEDLQADQYGKLGSPTPTLADVRFRNTMPDRQKTAAEFMKTQEQVYGAHPGVLAGDLVRDEKGVPVSGYDESSQTAYAPGGWSADPVTGAMVQKPATHVFLPKFNRNEIQRQQAIIGGIQSYPQPAPGNMATPWFMTGASPQMRQAYDAPHTRDPVRDDKLMQLNSTLQAHGLNFSPDQLHTALGRAVNAGMGQPVDENGILIAARTMRDEEAANQARVQQARAEYNRRSYIPPSGAGY